MERSPQRLERPPVVVVTGASAGIGRATAFAFAERGYAVGLIARGRERLESAERTIKSMGLPAFPVQADVADAATVDKAADLIEAEMGPIELWVNNAMATVFGPVWSLTPEEIRRVTEVTYLGQVHGTLSALRRMRPRDHGTIVQVGSALSYRSIPLQSAYCLELPLHSAAIGLLRGESRNPRLHGFAAQRTRARGQRRPPHHGATAGRQHAAIRLGAQPPSAPAATGPPDP
jgi:NADP-dependent 3-hydroxy acid dehydrogenase YdfG